MTSMTWIPDELCGSTPVRQVYAFIFAKDGRILLQDDDGRHNLPGGKPEGGEDPLSTLEREAWEESRVRLCTPHYLGYQRVEWKGEVFAQLRYAALIDHFLPKAPDPATGRIYGRLWVPPPLVNYLLDWGNAGKGQLTRAVREAHKLGAIWRAAPMEDPDASEDTSS